MNIRSLTFIVFISAISYHLFGQKRTCGTDAYHEILMQHPKLKKQFKDQQREIRKKVELRKNLNCTNVITIPVAVHFNGNVNNSNMTCLENACLAQIDVLNEDFAALNADISNYNTLTTNCPSTYPQAALSDGVCLEFCLAKFGHPASSGIAEGDYAITIGQYSWPGGTNGAGPDWAGYMNIFVEDNTGGLGVAPLSGGSNPDGNGFQVDASAFGGPGINCNSGTGINTNGTYNLGRTATHEAGHYFGLDHIFNGCSNGDGIADTPNQSQSNFGCPTVNTSTCQSNANNSCSTEDFFFNYMDYVNDACMWMFTADQAAVMYATADHNLWADHTLKCENDPNACQITSANVVVSPCDDNGTLSDPSDDTFTFTISPTGNNTGSTYNLSGDVFGSNFPYNVPIPFDNNGAGYLISGGILSGTITDGADPTCTLPFIVTPPSSCALPQASFIPNTDIAVCQNAPNMTFYDTSSNNPTSWTWSVSGPDATVINDFGTTYIVAFNVTGMYTVTLTATNANGSDTKSETFMVTVVPATDPQCSVCTYTLSMWDQPGNGWGNNQSLDVTINGSTTNYAGPTGQVQNVNLSVATGEIITVFASVGGPNASEQMSWRLFDEQGYVVLGDGDTYGTGPGNAQGNNAPSLAAATAGTYTTTADCSPLAPCESYTLTLVLDNYPDETAWQILDNNGNYIYQSQGYDGQNYQTITETFCLPEGCFDFLMVDFYGDGICCGEGNGSYSLVKDTDNTVVASGGQFTGTESTNFCVTIVPACPEILDVTDPITSGDYVADSLLNSAGIVNSPDVVNFYAGDTICLTDNFEVQLGAEFMAAIGDCTNYMAAREESDYFLYVNASAVEVKKLVNIRGKEVRTKKMLSTDVQQKIQILDYSPGIYFLEMENDQGVKTYKKVSL